MKAVLKNERSEVLLHPDADGVDKPTVMVVVDVDYVNDDGTLYLTQPYGRLPELFDETEFDRVAAGFQQEIEHLAAHAGHFERVRTADDVIARLKAKREASAVADTLQPVA